jgi:hypothetical protein
LGESFWLKTHRSLTGEVVVAVCDEELLGARLRVRRDYEVLVSRDFYLGRLANWEDVKEAISRGTIINLLGNKVVSRAVAEGLISEASCVEIDRVKHVQIFR